MRKTFWPAGPWIAAGQGDHLTCHGIEGANELTIEQVFREEDHGDTWELHPPRTAVPTLYAPASWILFLFPALGGRDAFAAAVDALTSGADFAGLLLDLWRKAGREDQGLRLVAALGKLDRGLFHKSLAGDVTASTRILEHLMRACKTESPR